MPGLVPGIHDFGGSGIKEVDGTRNSGRHGFAQKYYVSCAIGVNPACGHMPGHRHGKSRLISPDSLPTEGVGT
jgi:hypothetical protein